MERTAGRRASHSWPSGAHLVRALVVAAIVALSLPLSAPGASAGGTTPPITVSASSSATVLYGTPSDVGLTASNPSGAPAGYNLAFRAVLPVGVAYVAGSASPAMAGEPTQYVDAVTGATTLVWANVADLQPGSTFKLDIKVQGAVEPAPDAILPGSSYALAVDAFVNTDPRTVPAFDPVTGAPVASSSTGSASSSTTTTVSALEVTKAEPSPEAELLRGVHDHQTVYTVTVTNNALHGTSALTVQDWVPAGLEFLGCGGVDNTPPSGSPTPEYPGSGSLAVGPPLAPALCPAPTLVETVAVDPDGAGPLPFAVYTHVVWAAPDLGPAQSATIQYKAAVPLRANALFPDPQPPTTGDQAANLANNTGASTADEQGLTNLVAATGTYSGPLGQGTNPVTAVATHRVTAEDLAIQKSVDSSTFSAGAIVNFTLHIETSEYRYATGTIVTDTLPSGLCPLGPANYAVGAPAECAPTGAQPTTPYSSVVQNADGTFTITWDLGTLPTDATPVITFPARNRAAYHPDFTQGPPTVAGDSFTNQVAVVATTKVTCGPSDPTCSGGGPPISPTEPPSRVDTDDSSAGQTAAKPTITKEVALAPTSGAPDCTAATYVHTPPTTPPLYQKGDEICFRLRVDFPAGAFTRLPVVTDFLPPNSTYVNGSAAPTAANTVTQSLTVEPTALTWALGDPLAPTGDRYASAGQVFELTFGVVATADPTAGNTFDLVDNLMKMSTVDTAGTATSYRDAARYQIGAPDLRLVKGVASVNGGPVNPFASHVTGVVVRHGDQVRFRVDVSNLGLQPAYGTSARDLLPSQLTCADVSAISDGGSCTNGSPAQINWTGLPTVAPGNAAVGISVFYTITVPTGVAESETLTNTAGVRTYDGHPNTGGAPNVYVPVANIDPTLEPQANAPRADDTATVRLPATVLTKTRTAPYTEAGNNATDQATIGETVHYTVTATVPAGTTVHQGVMSDPLGPNQSYLAGTAVATLNGGALPVGATIVGDTGTNTVTLTLPGTYAVPAGGPDAVFEIVFDAKVDDVRPANERGKSLDNTATVTHNDSAGTALTPITASTSTTIVEPDLTVAKTDNTGGAAVIPGQTVHYTVTPSNGAGSAVSSAHHVVVVDTVPAGLTVVPASITNGGVYDSGARTITWTLAAPLAPGASAPSGYDATIDNPGVGAASLTNTVVATAASLDSGGRTTGAGYLASTSDTLHLGGPTVVKTVSSPLLTNGESTTYTVTATIPADLAFPDLTLLDTLPDGMAFDAYGSADCTAAGGGGCGADVTLGALAPPVADAAGTTRAAWFIGDVVANGAVRTVTVTYVAHLKLAYTAGGNVGAGDVLRNSARLVWNQTNGPDPTSVPALGDFDSSILPVTADVTCREPSLSITKSRSQANPQPGQVVTWTVKVTNATGPRRGPAHDVTVTDTVPAGLAAPTAISGGGTYNPATRKITWFVPGPINPGGSVTFTFDAGLAASSTLADNAVVTNSVTITSYYGVSGGASDANRYRKYTGPTATASVTARFPTVTTNKTLADGTSKSGNAFVNTPFGWRVAYTNTSPYATATAFVATDTLPANWTYVSGSTVITLPGGGTLTADPTIVTSAGGDQLTWTGLGSLPSGSSLVVAFSATPSSSASLGGAHPNVNHAAGTYQDASGASGNRSRVYAANDDTAEAIIAAADLSIVKSVLDPTVVAGSPMRYGLSVHNGGPDAAGGPIVVNDTVPAGTTVQSASGTGWICSTTPTTISCNLPGPLASGADAPALTLTVLIASGFTGTLTNTATVTGPTYDPNLANNTSTVGPTVVTAQADLSIAKSHTGTFTPGTNGTYTISVTNLGPSDNAGQITVADTLPVGMTFVDTAGTDPSWACSSATPTTFSCLHAAGLVAGASAGPISVTVAVAPTVTASPLVNTATVSSGTTVDPNPGNDTATDPTTITPSADLAIVKTHTGAFTPGTNGTYTFAVSNLGPSDAAAVITVTDQLPAGLSYVSGSSPGNAWSCSATAGQLVTCTLVSPPLAAGTAAPPITLTVAVDPAYVGGPFTNTATVGSSTTPDPVPGNNSSTDVTGPPTPQADLSIAKTHTGSFTAGTNGTYTVTVSNLGPSANAGQITVADTLPAGMTYVNASGTGWVCSSATPTTFSCLHAAGLAAGASAAPISVTVAVAPTVTASPLVNTATVSSGTTHDPNPANDTANDPTVIVTSADLAIVKTHTGAFTPGTNGIYTLTVTNHGPSDAAAAITVTDQLPAGLSYVSATSGGAWACSATIGQLVTCTLANPPLGALTSAAQITLTVAVDPAYVGGPFTNTATVGSSTTPDPVPANNSSTDVTGPVTPQADLSIAKSHAGSFTAGTNGTYSIVVSNLGPSDNAGQITVADTLPVGMTFVGTAGTDPSWACSSATPTTFSCLHAAGLATGTSAAPITVTVAVASTVTTSPLVNTATVSSGTTVDPNPTNNTATDPTVIVTSADLAVTKTHTGAFTPGQDGQFTISVVNNGPSAAAGAVTVSDQLPAGLTYVSATSTGNAWSCSVTVGQLVTCTLASPPLAAGAIAPDIVLTVAVAPEAYPTVINTAVVTSPTPDPDPDNNHSTDVVTVLPVADLAIAKTHPAGEILVGSRLTYTITVTNLGPTADPGPVAVEDTLPAGLTFVDGTGTGWTCAAIGSAVSCSHPGALADGGVTAIALTVAVGPEAAPVAVNTVTVKGSADPNPDNDTATDPATITPVADLALTKTLVGGVLTSGSPAVYVLTVTNRGPSPAAGPITIVDLLPTGLVYQSASGDGWSCTAAATRVLCLNPATLPVGASSTVRITVMVQATSGTLVNQATVTSATKTTPGLPPATAEAAARVQTRSSTGVLPRTGADPSNWVGLALVSLLLGSGLVVATRRRRA